MIACFLGDHTEPDVVEAAVRPTIALQGEVGKGCVAGSIDSCHRSVRTARGPAPGYRPAGRNRSPFRRQVGRVSQSGTPSQSPTLSMTPGSILDRHREDRACAFQGRIRPTSGRVQRLEMSQRKPPGSGWQSSSSVTMYSQPIRWAIQNPNDRIAESRERSPRLPPQLGCNLLPRIVIGRTSSAKSARWTILNYNQGVPEPVRLPKHLEGI